MKRQFDYTAVNALGQQVRGKLEGFDQKDVMAQVKKMGYFPTRVVLS